MWWLTRKLNESSSDSIPFQPLFRLVPWAASQSRFLGIIKEEGRRMSCRFRRWSDVSWWNEEECQIRMNSKGYTEGVLTSTFLLFSIFLFHTMRSRIPHFSKMKIAVQKRNPSKQFPGKCLNRNHYKIIKKMLSGWDGIQWKSKN